jgi:hypothetical protein
MHVEGACNAVVLHKRPRHEGIRGDANIRAVLHPPSALTADKRLLATTRWETGFVPKLVQYAHTGGQKKLTVL